MNVRSYCLSDLSAVTQLFTASVQGLAANHYDEVQRNVWAPENPDLNRWRKRLASVHTLVAEENDELAGFIAYERTGHIDLLYVSPDYPRRGVASTLYRHAETALLCVGVRDLFTEASLAARPFFEQQGFRVDAEQTITRRGVGFRRYTMRKDGACL